MASPLYIQISSLEHNPAHIYLELALADIDGRSRKIAGTQREICSRVEAVIPKNQLIAFEKILQIIIQNEIGFRLIDMHASPSAAALLRKNEEKKSFDTFRLEPSSVYSILEQISAIATLTWNGTKVLFDSLSTPFSLEALIEKDSALQQGQIELFFIREHRDQRETIFFPNKQLFFIKASPNLVLNGALIQRVHEDISWKSIAPFSEKRASKISTPFNTLLKWIEEIEEDEELSKAFQLVLCDIQKDQKIPEKSNTKISEDSTAHHIRPILQFHDTRGLISSLLIEYTIQGKSTLFPFIPDFSLGISPKEPFRELKKEQQFEEELLTVGFERSTFDQERVISFRYFCPSDKIDSALELLLGIGWNIIDSQHQPIYLLNDIALHVENSLLSSKQVAIEGVDGEKHRWNDFLFFESIQKKSFMPSLGGYSLFIPPKIRDFLYSIGDEIVLTSEKKVSFSSKKRGIFEGEKPITLTIASHTERSSLEEREKKGLLFYKTLRPYQEIGVQWMIDRWKANEPCLLADEMGLGKTVQILAWISKISNYPSTQSKKIGIIAPKSLLYNWKKECEASIPEALCYIYQGEDREKIFSQFVKAPKDATALLLTSFHTVRSDIALLQKIPFFTLIVDEAQSIKNAESKAFQAIESLSRAYTILMTGTPIENSMRDLWTLFSLLSPDLLGNSDSFLRPFTTGDEEIAKKALKRTQQLISPFLMRRTKKAVVEDLPELLEETLFVSMEKAEEERYFAFLQLLKKGQIVKSGDGGIKERMEILEAITRLRQIVCHHELFSFQLNGEAAPTLPTAKWELFFEELSILISEGKKVLIFSHFSTIIDRIMERASEYGWMGVAYHGGVRHSIESVVETFQNDPKISFFATTMKSGGTGLNITAADAVLIYDPWWNRAVEDQAIARAHRIGRREGVIVKRYITHQSIEERVYEIGKGKKELFNQLFDSESLETISMEGSFDDLLFDLFQGEVARLS